MKLFIAALVTFSLIVMLCVFGTVVGIRIIDEMLEMLYSASAKSGAVPENAVEISEKLLNKWEKDFFPISMMLPHHHLDEIKEELVSLMAYSETEEYAEWLESGALLEESLLHVRGLLGVSMDNIL